MQARSRKSSFPLQFPIDASHPSPHTRVRVVRSLARYDITNFVEKNKDELSIDIEELTTVKTNFDTLMFLAKRDAEKKADAEAAKAASSKKNKGGAKKKKTVSRTFGDSLFALMAKLRATEHHYIRCLKPNQTLKAGDWDNEFMFRQLSYSGTLEVTEIRKAGLNVRRPLAHFYRYYKICADDQTTLRAGTVTKRCIMLLEQLGIDENKWRVGKTLVFLKDYEIMDQLDKLREEKIVEYAMLLRSRTLISSPHISSRMGPTTQSFALPMAGMLSFSSLTFACVKTSSSSGASGGKCAASRATSKLKSSVRLSKSSARRHVSFKSMAGVASTTTHTTRSLASLHQRRANRCPRS